MNKLPSNLSKKQLEKRDKIYRLSDGGSLYLEVHPTGSAYWRMKFRSPITGKEDRLAFGVFPEVSLKEARAKRDEARKQLRDGVDPKQARKIAKQKKVDEYAHSFREVATSWHERFMQDKSESHRKRTWRDLENHLFSSIGDIPIAHITTQDFLRGIRAIEDKGLGETVHRTKNIAERIFSYAVAEGIGGIKTVPNFSSRDVLKPAPKVQHYKTLSPEEMSVFLNKLSNNEARLYPHTKLATELIFYTFTRTNELINAQWSEIDFEEKIWTIPAERMKMEREHLVPLSEQVLSRFNRLRELSTNKTYVFPSKSYKAKTMSNGTILKAIKALGYKGELTGHGARAFALTNIKEKLGYMHEIPDLQLAHVKKSKNDRAYDRVAFMPERKAMMQEWADYLDKLKQSVR